jgi:UDP-N-acetylglucosamine diphosphorylase / glucose-1-phosphate thymidylyltransferase / UDP-N-acetylgalactosamine diphosphorylase / glucosamine-1-phosphate N-acetyltransferase / galactosamine-1-phosphate N-acetyltransferase
MEVLMLTAEDFFDLSVFEHKELFSETEFVWDGIKNINSYLSSIDYPVIPDNLYSPGVPLPHPVVCYQGEFLNGSEMEISPVNIGKGGLKVHDNGKLLEGASVIMAGAILLGKKIKIGKGSLVEPGAYINSPSVIGDCSEVRHGAYMRGNCLVGNRCVVGHTTEVKNSVFLDDAKAGHFAYLGDSILGNNVNLGAGTKLANLRFIKGDLKIKTPMGFIDTGLRKFGAIMGDAMQTGCNSVTSPGAVFGRKCLLPPNTTAPAGYHNNSSIVR